MLEPVGFGGGFLLGRGVYNKPTRLHHRTQSRELRVNQDSQL
jgi:hypothetical protein